MIKLASLLQSDRVRASYEFQLTCSIILLVSSTVRHAYNNRPEITCLSTDAEMKWFREWFNTAYAATVASADSTKKNAAFEATVAAYGTGFDKTNKNDLPLQVSFQEAGRSAKYASLLKQGKHSNRNACNA